MPLPMLHPAVTELIARVSSLRAEVARLLVAIDDKIFLEKPYLLALHEQKIGRAELSLMRSEHQVRKLRRLVERVQAATSRHESFDVETIEAELTAELAAWEEKLADRVRLLAETQWATEPVDAALADAGNRVWS